MSGELMQPEFSTRLLGLFRAIDTLLADHHTLRASLRAGPPLGAYENGVWRPAPLEAGVARFGAGPMFGLWVECRDVEALRVVWTGKPTVVEPEPETAQPESTQESTPTEAAP